MPLSETKRRELKEYQDALSRASRAWLDDLHERIRIWVERNPRKQ